MIISSEKSDGVADRINHPSLDNARMTLKEAKPWDVFLEKALYPAVLIPTNPTWWCCIWKNLMKRSPEKHLMILKSSPLAARPFTTFRRTFKPPCRETVCWSAYIREKQVTVQLCALLKSSVPHETPLIRWKFIATDWVGEMHIYRERQVCYHNSKQYGW